VTTAATITAAVRDALALLGIRRLLLGIHDAAFPADPAEDTGCGTPNGDGAERFLAWAASLGFDGVQLGPQGITSAFDPSPYDGTLFSRNPLALSLARLARGEGGALLRRETLAELVRGRPASQRVAYPYAFRAAARALAEALATLRRRRAAGERGALALAAGLAAFRAAEAGWLERDALWEIVAREHGGTHPSRWGGAAGALDARLWAPAAGEEAAAAARRRALLAAYADEVEGHAFAQLLLEEQHQALRARARAAGLALFADLQAGMSERDAWAAEGFVLRDWRMGAPPSRTNPEGQPWGYAVLDPRADAALAFVAARARRAFAGHDGLRVDHPHALVCPWVYRAEGDPGAAVRAGARLFDSPALADHPELAAFAIARPEQIDASLPRHADGWVTSLDDDQVERYALRLDAVVRAAREAGHDVSSVVCEVLSTQPYPLKRVLERHGLGRFRVTQKADLARPDDVYRGENARPEDWIMLGNHDTRTIWAAAEAWRASGAASAQASYLATRLVPRAADREAWARRTADDPAALAQARCADLFVGPASNVFVYFTDLLGEREPYNAPGTVSEANWTLRVPAEFAAVHARRSRACRALDLPSALAAALRSRGDAFSASHAALLAALDPTAP
jgi:4-alpha-glucanotransferase